MNEANEDMLKVGIDIVNQILNIFKDLNYLFESSLTYTPSAIAGAMYNCRHETIH
jgi:hypothetical protein